MTPRERKKYESFWEYVKCLKKDFPADIPVSVRTYPSGSVVRKGVRYRGWSSFWEGRSGITIHIERNSDVESMVERLFHEWAHVYHGEPCRKEHPLEWWKAHGRIVNHYIDNQKGDEIQ